MVQTPPSVIRVAHSPDSDDAFMFYGLAHNKVDTEGLTFSHHLTDIETLNREALNGTYELTAISYHAYAYVRHKYALLTVGSSVGDKYGPIVVAKEKFSRDELKTKTVAVPGEWTTAYLALKIWEPQLKTVVVPFDEIIERVAAGEFDAGLIIHEGQLTFTQNGLKKIVDLGQWWFETVNLKLPLGGNAIRKDLDPELIQTIGRALKRSIEYGLAHKEEALDYALGFARGLERSQASEFVDMYVNQDTIFSGMDVRRAVRMLLYMGHGAGLLPEKIDPEFIDVKEPAGASSSGRSGSCH